uniref:RRM domain-containing protein n=1 Tax=Salix viminalis TaxID=40686 RepID=A0A6N2LG24_SALVM
MAYQAIPGPSSGSSSSSGFQYMNSPFGDTTYTKVFVGGLAWETQSETMRRYFEQFGDILEAVVISDKNTGRSKGYGFVSDFPRTTTQLGEPVLILLRLSMVDGLIVIWLQLGDPGHLYLMDVRDQLPRTLQVCKPPEGLMLEVLATSNQFLMAINKA